MTTYTMNETQFQKIKSVTTDLSMVLKNIEEVVRPEIVQILLGMQKKLEETIKDYSEQHKFSVLKNFPSLEEVADKNGFKSKWSVSNVDATKINEFFPFPINILIYSNNKVNVSNVLTWLELWRFADNLIKNSGDTHHIFIEQFIIIDYSLGIMEVITGS